MSESPRPVGPSLKLLRSGLPQGAGLDALLLAALVCIGVSVHRVAPDLLYGYVGVVLLGLWWLIGRATAAKKGGQA